MSAKATEQLNIRVHPDTKTAFRDRAKREGMSQAQLLEAFLRMKGTLPRVDLEAPTNGSHVTGARAEPAPESETDTISLATWLSGRTGIPRALCASAIAAGRVSIGGGVYASGEVPAQLLALGVTLDGNEVR